MVKMVPASAKNGTKRMIPWNANVDSFFIEIFGIEKRAVK